MIRILAPLAIVCSLAAPAGAVVLASFDAGVHNRFVSGTDPNPGFLVDEALIRGVGVNSRFTLITPQHAITAAHAAATPIEFRGADGVVRTYTASTSTDLITNLGGGTTGVSDVRLWTLDAPIPVAHGINPLAVVDSPASNLVGQEFLVIGQNNQAGRNVVEITGIAEFGPGDRPTAVIGYSFDTATNGGTGGLGADEAGIIGGDSGHAALIDVGGTVAVIGAHFGISVPSGSSATDRDRYDSFSSVLSPYLDDIEAITLADGFALNRVSVPALVTAVPEPSVMAMSILAIGGLWYRKLSPSRSRAGKRAGIGVGAILVGLIAWAGPLGSAWADHQTEVVADARSPDRPNVLIIISDDQSYPHASAYQSAAVKTPGFDLVARSGVLFTQAIVPSPGCSPMRAAFLSGLNCWQCGAAGTHGSTYPTDLPSFVDRLAQAGYRTGMTGKGWSPGSAKGWPHNPAGPTLSKHTVKPPPGISRVDYAANFDDFIDTISDDETAAPFCFWMGGQEPHRPYDPGIGRRSGIDLAAIEVPEFLIDDPKVREDIADYLAEIEWFDAAVLKAIDRLQKDGLWENTIVVATSDNGMPFPRAKANLYDAGIHVPLAISWPARFSTPGTYRSVVSLLDVTATIYQATGVDAPKLAGHSLVDSLSHPRQENGQTIFAPVRTAAYSARERHSSSRYHTLSYPGRCIRTNDHLLIVNERPERWPAGAPTKYETVTYDGSGKVIDGILGPDHGGYHDIDPSPTLQTMIARRNEDVAGQRFRAATALRPAVELYDLRSDPACLSNLADSGDHQDIRRQLSSMLDDYRRESDDLRVTDPASAEKIWENYPRIWSVRWFPPPKWLNSAKSTLGPSWLESRRPMAP